MLPVVTKVGEVAAGLLPLRSVQPEGRHEEGQARQSLFAAPGVIRRQHATHAVAEQHHGCIGITPVHGVDHRAEIGTQHRGEASSPRVPSERPCPRRSGTMKGIFCDVKPAAMEP